MEFSKNFRSLMDVNGNFTLMEFGGIPRLVKSNKFFKRGVDISGNLRLINFSEFFRFQFRVRMVHCRTFLLVIGGGKLKFKVIPIDNYFV